MAFLACLVSLIAILFFPVASPWILKAIAVPVETLALLASNNAAVAFVPFWTLMKPTAALVEMLVFQDQLAAADPALTCKHQIPFVEAVQFLAIPEKSAAVVLALIR